MKANRTAIRRDELALGSYVATVCPHNLFNAGHICAC